MIIRILHLSDLHLKSNENHFGQDLVTESLANKVISISETEPFNLVIISGDITYSGKDAEYNVAQTYIETLKQKLNISEDKVIVIPGNHDVDRSKIGEGNIQWWYKFTNEDMLNTVLSSSVSFPVILKKLEAFHNFAKTIMKGVQFGTFQEFVKKLTFDDNGEEVSIKIIGLNSALFCGYDGDDKKQLALGLKQAHDSEKTIDKKADFVITCVHHPFNDGLYHDCDSPSSKVVSRFSDIVLSGHLHTPNNTFVKSSTGGETLFVSAGASFEKRTSENAFDIIELDTTENKGNITFYKYIPGQHEWRINYDIESSGKFEFPLIRFNVSNKKSVPLVHKTVPVVKFIYELKLNANFENIDRELVENVLKALKDITQNSELVIKAIREGSVNVYFETNKEIGREIIGELNKIIDSAEITTFNLLTEEEFTILNFQTEDISNWSCQTQPQFQIYLNDAGATFSHPRVDQVFFDDVFVWPDLMKTEEFTDKKHSNTNKYISSKTLFDRKIDKVGIKYAIYGQDNAGKTTLIKGAVKSFYKKGFIPIVLLGQEIKDIKSEKIKEYVNNAFKKQYISSYNLFQDFDLSKVVLILDDFHMLKFNQGKYKANVTVNLTKLLPNVIIFANDLMQYESYKNGDGLKNILHDFDKYLLLEFGPKVRYELIKKWNLIGRQEILAPNESIRINQETEKYVDSIVGKNVVPSFPLFVLTILQAIEASPTQKPEYNQHGFYYELLINEALNKAIPKKEDISLYLNYFTEYCHFLFSEKIGFSPLHFDSFKKFHETYSKDYQISEDESKLVAVFKEANLINFDDTHIKISYRYIYYFFVARYLAANLSNEKVKNKVSAMCERIHRDEFSNIIMFLTHLSKEAFIIDELLANSRSIFRETPPAKLEKDVDFINEMIGNLPESVYKNIDIEKAKNEDLEAEEQLQRQEKEFSSEKEAFDYNLEEDINSLDIISNYTRAAKTMEILGQVTKKYWGSLKAEKKIELVEETYMLGLRSIGFYYNLMSTDSGILVDYIKQMIRKRDQSDYLSKSDVEQMSKEYLFALCSSAAFAFIKRTSESIGFEKLSGSFDSVLALHSFNSFKLIDASIKLDYQNRFPFDYIKKLKNETSSNFLATTVLKQLVLSYLYLYHTEIGEKQQIFKLMDIKIESQRFIDATSKTKKRKKGYDS